MNDRFLQLHFLTSYPASLLNRDDVGFAKRIPFGGAVRTRISSQCQKRHWRTHDGEHALAGIGEPMSIRSRLTFEREVVEPMIREGLDAVAVRAATEAVMAAVLGESAKAKKAKEAAKDSAEDSKEGKGKKSKKGDATDEGSESLQTGQITVLGRAEVEFLASLARKLVPQADDPKKLAAAVKETFDAAAKKNLASLKRAAGLDGALFGRMVTSDLLAQGDAAVHVAHAFTVHGEATENDYFSAVDDLQASEGGLGSGHIGSVELTSGLFYGYVAVDLPLLVSNLEGCPRADWTRADKTLAAAVVQRLVHLIATVSPGAKLGSTAPHSYASLFVAELGVTQPRTLANAFLRPVALRDDVLGASYGALGRHVGELDAMYGVGTRRAFAGLGDTTSLATNLGGAAQSLAGVAEWVASEMRAG